MRFRLTPRSMTLDDIELYRPLSFNFQRISLDFGRNNRNLAQLLHFLQFLCKSKYYCKTRQDNVFTLRSLNAPQTNLVTVLQTRKLCYRKDNRAMRAI